MRFLPLIVILSLTLLVLALGSFVSIHFYWGLILFLPLALLGIYDLVQKQHSILRNYPLAAHFRFWFEAIRPEIHQYFVESDIDGRPYNRDQRSLIYERAKNIEGLKPFGTELDVYGNEYEWLNHSMAPRTQEQRTISRHRRRGGLQSALFLLVAEYFGNEFRRDQPQRDHGNEHRRQERRILSLHRRRRAQPLPFETWWRPGLADRHRLLWLS